MATAAAAADPRPGSGGVGGSSAPPPPSPPSLSSPPSSSSPLLPRILSGSIGSLATALAVTPLEVAKIRQQAAGAASSPLPPRAPFGRGSGGASSSSSAASMTFRGVKVGSSGPCPGCGAWVLNNGLMECAVPSAKFPSSASASSTAAESMGTLATLRSIFRSEGAGGLYAGLKPTLAMSVPNTVLYFASYDEISGWMKRRASEKAASNSTATGGPAYVPLVAGSAARLLASLATAPLELVRTRQASFGSGVDGNGSGNRNHNHSGSSNNRPKQRAPPGMVEEFRLLLRQNGFASLYVGLAPTLWRDVPFSAIYWLFLERFRERLKHDSGRLGAWGGQFYEERGTRMPPGVEAAHAFVSGAAAGSIAACCTTPFDVVKTRRQMVGASDAVAPRACDRFGLEEVPRGGKAKAGSTGATGTARAAGAVRRDLGTFGHVRLIARREGIAGLWKGNGTRTAKVAPACAIMISCYEFGKRVFGEVL
ncbi:hypothetical protein ACHAWF_010213 [Thalassiosira exigua]